MTERLKKCDALLSRERCTIGLIGVWNFRGTNEHGGKTILPEFEHVTFEGREVYVVFDSDVMVKREVAYALHRFGAWLTEIRRARVKYIYLPDSGHGKKQGIDDYLVAGHSLEKPEALCRVQAAADS